jgi:hypothetical protein
MNIRPLSILPQISTAIELSMNNSRKADDTSLGKNVAIKACVPYQILRGFKEISHTSNSGGNLCDWSQPQELAMSDQLPMPDDLYEVS